ncbi:MAG: hypothetical protein ACFFDN_34315 [Candidatus Hodarchaeota archaeon]
MNAIWLRKPLIISFNDDNNINKYIDEVLSFIPDYRLLIICGRVPKRVIYQKSNIKILELNDKQLITQSLFSSFEEENLSTPPLQLICFETDEWFFSHILNRLNLGWIATTSLDKDKITNLLQSKTSFSLYQDVMTFFFLNNSSQNNVFEQQLIKTVNDKSEAIVRLYLQKKMSEIRYVGQALIKEIEQGNSISQAEIEEMYNIDTLSFKRTIEVLKSETHMDISKYIDFTPKVISAILNRIIKLNGVLTSICLKQKKIIGIIKKEQFNANDSSLFLSFYSLLSKLEKDYHFGKNINLSFQFDTNKQLLFVKTAHVSDFEDIVFAFILESNVNIFLFRCEIDNIVKEV